MPDHWHSPQGWPLNAVYGYTRFLLEFLDREAPEHCAAAFDESLGSCFRNDLLPGYKSSRELPDEALAFQLDSCREVTERLGIPCYGGERYEADDYLASLARVCRQQGMPVAIMTRDKDLGQIIEHEDDRWWDYAAGLSLDGAGFSDKFGVRPDQFADYLALVGDPVDDIPGVPGVGAKTAAKLLQACGNLDALWLRLEEIPSMGIRGAARIQQNLLDHREQVELARQLTVLEDSVPGVEDLPQFSLRPEAINSLVDFLEELDLEGPLTRRCEALRRKVES